ncbi:ribonuclease H-like domain-containing protein, partial [Tanacetum coccineum]
MVIRSQLGVVKPISRLSLHMSSISPLPKNPSDTLKDPQWCDAMYDEYNMLVKNGTWLHVRRPAGVNIVRFMWLFKHKFHADGNLSHYKARLVANGSSQQLGVDFDETFSSVVKPDTIHTGQVAYLLLYVDDIILTASSIALLQHLIGSLHREFDVTDLGALNYFLGISALRHSTGLFLSQRKIQTGPDGVPVQDPSLYRSHAGGLQYLTFTRPDLSYAVPWTSAFIYMPPPLLLWLVILMPIGQHNLSPSRAGAEYRGVANVLAETSWLRNLLRELHSPLSAATLCLLCQ